MIQTEYKVLTVEEANEFINDKVKKIKFEGTIFRYQEVIYKYSVLLNDNTQDMIYVDDIVTVHHSKVM